MYQYNGHLGLLAIFNYVIEISMHVCSIIGYKGESLAAPLLVTCLQKMEYRGYDSVGIGTINEGKVSVKKGVGKVEDVDSKLLLKVLPGRIGIGHTRWATHGKVTESNAHPHTSCSGEIDVVRFLNYTDRAIFLDNRDIVILKGSEMEIFSFDGAPVSRPITQVAWEFGGIDKGTYAHFTIKEINEQVETIANSGKGQENKIEQVSELLKS